MPTRWVWCKHVTHRLSAHKKVWVFVLVCLMKALICKRSLKEMTHQRHFLKNIREMERILKRAQAKTYSFVLKIISLPWMLSICSTSIPGGHSVFTYRKQIEIIFRTLMREKRERQSLSTATLIELNAKKLLPSLQDDWFISKFQIPSVFAKEQFSGWPLFRFLMAGG